MHNLPRNPLLSVLLLTAITLAGVSVILASPQGDAVAADHSFTSALAKADQANAGKLLDTEFTWTDRTGKTRTKSEFLPALATLAADADADVKVIDAGQMVLIHGNHRIPSQNASTPAGPSRSAISGLLAVVT